MSNDYVSLLDKILKLAQKSCPEKVVRQGNLDLWEANRRFVIAGVEFIQQCCKEATGGVQNYRDLMAVASEVYEGLRQSQQSFIEQLTRRESEFTNLIEVAQDVSAAMYNNVDALMAFDEIDQAHQAARRIPPKWREN